VTDSKNIEHLPIIHEASVRMGIEAEWNSEVAWVLGTVQDLQSNRLVR